MPPTILVAPGPYKECLTAQEVATAMQQGIADIMPEATSILRPLSDGGSGISRLLVEETGGEMVQLDVCGPLEGSISSSYGILGDGRTAVVESASACGLALVPKDRRNPLQTTTYGVGQLIRHAVESRGARKVIVGCGDSATNDCGIGMAIALGVRFEGLDPTVAPTASDLSRIRRIDATGIPAVLKAAEFVVACNLTSILCGPDGTTRIYAPQKGASLSQVEELEPGVRNFVDIAFLPGAGGSGGLAGSLYAFLRARLLYSLDVVNAYLRLEELLEKSSLVLTGEGTIDDRTATGKVACGLALQAKRFDLPVVAVVGAISRDHEDIYYNGIDVVASIQEGPVSLEESMGRAPELIARTTARVMRCIFRLGKRP
jgi:glycerate kinase